MQDEKQQAKDVTLLPQNGFFKWLDNFWYHNKIKTIIALVLLVSITICVVQCATKAPEPDVLVCYAGSTSLSSNQETIENALSTLQGTSDLLEFYTYFIVSGSALAQDTLENFQDDLDLGNAYIYMLDAQLFSKYTALVDGTRYVVPIADILEDTTGLDLTEDGYGVYLRSTALYSQQGFQNLPGDTVLCLRVSFSISNSFSRTSTSKYEKSKALFEKMIACEDSSNG